MALTKSSLRNKVESVLKKQGYRVKDGSFELRHNDRESWRKAHRYAKAERLSNQKDFILKHASRMNEQLINGKDLEIEKIKPRLIEVETGTQWETVFRWWNLVWWSLPHEQAYGRQMRFVVWDDYHKSPIGLIGLQSPILSWKVRDDYLGIQAEDRDFWVNQSMSAQRLGALPPYNHVLGGKLVSSLMTSDVVRKKFQDKYQDRKTLLMKRTLPSQLLFLTTTGAYGKSSVYSRMKFNDERVSEFIGYTRGTGSFHIPNSLYEDLVKFLEKRNFDVGRGYGNGPSRKMRLIVQALNELGFYRGTTHGIERAVYLFPLAKNLKEVIGFNAKPRWYKRSVTGLTDYWKERWAIPRAERNDEYLSVNKDTFIEEALEDLERCVKLQKNF